MKVYFKEDNQNVLIFEKDGQTYPIVVPPTDGIDIIDLKNELINQKLINKSYYPNNKYFHNISCYVVITNKYERKVYHEGYLICLIKLK